MEIYVIANGRVLSYILDPMFEKYLPIIPSEVSSTRNQFNSITHHFKICEKSSSDAFSVVIRRLFINQFNNDQYVTIVDSFYLNFSR